MDWWRWIWRESLYFQRYKSRSDKYLLLISHVATCSDTQRQKIPFVAKQKSASVWLSAAVSLPIVANSCFGVESHQPCRTHCFCVKGAFLSTPKTGSFAHTLQLCDNELQVILKTTISLTFCSLSTFYNNTNDGETKAKKIWANFVS